MLFKDVSKEVRKTKKDFWEAQKKAEKKRKEWFGERPKTLKNQLMNLTGKR